MCERTNEWCERGEKREGDEGGHERGWCELCRPASSPARLALMLDVGDMAADDWEWPEEGIQRSPYYAPNRIETKEPPAPNPQPKLIKREPKHAPPPGAASAAEASTAGAGVPPAPRQLQVSDYAWADDGLVVKVYLTLPGVQKQKVQCEFRDDGVDFCAEGMPDNTIRVLSLRRLYDQIHVPGCSYKVLESKGKVVLTLAKPPRRSSFDELKEWPTLHFGSGADNVAASGMPGKFQKSFDNMLAGMPRMPSGPVSRR